MSKFKNPGYIGVNPAEARYVKYKPYIVEFFAQVPTDQETVTFDEVRAYFSTHADPKIVAEVPNMSNGILENLCLRHGVERV